MKDWKLVTEATCHIIAFFLLVLDCSCVNADLWKWNGCYYQPTIWMINGTVWCMVDQPTHSSTQENDNDNLERLIYHMKFNTLILIKCITESILLWVILKLIPHDIINWNSTPIGSHTQIWRFTCFQNLISQVEPASNLIFILWPSEVIIDPCSNQHNDRGWFCNNICDLSFLIRTWNMKTKTMIQLVICIHICTKQMKIKRFISGTCGRIKPDVSNVKPGLHVSLFGSINSRKAANVKQSSFARLFYFTVQCTVIGNGFMCKIKQT